MARPESSTSADSGEHTELPMSDRAVTEIQQRIISGEWSSDLSLSEGDIATDLRMSKTPVRHALALLRRESWVEVLPRSGYRVVPATLKGARDLAAVRIALEGEAAAQAAQRSAWSPRLVGELTDYVEQERAAGPGGPVDLVTHHHFHDTVATLSGNDELRRILGQILLKLQRYWNLEWVRPHVAEWGLSHAPLAEAISSGDADAARARAGEHAAAGRDRLLDLLLASDALLNADLTRRPGRRSRIPPPGGSD